MRARPLWHTVLAGFDAFDSHLPEGEPTPRGGDVSSCFILHSRATRRNFADVPTWFEFFQALCLDAIALFSMSSCSRVLQAFSSSPREAATHTHHTFSTDWFWWQCWCWCTQGKCFCRTDYDVPIDYKVGNSDSFFVGGYNSNGIAILSVFFL